MSRPDAIVIGAGIVGWVLGADDTSTTGLAPWGGLHAGGVQWRGQF